MNVFTISILITLITYFIVSFFIFFFGPCGNASFGDDLFNAFGKTSLYAFFILGLYYISNFYYLSNINRIFCILLIFIVCMFLDIWGCFEEYDYNGIIMAPLILLFAFLSLLSIKICSDCRLDSTIKDEDLIVISDETYPLDICEFKKDNGERMYVIYSYCTPEGEVITDTLEEDFKVFVSEDGACRLRIIYKTLEVSYKKQTAKREETEYIFFIPKDKTMKLIEEFNVDIDVLK